ncbi:MAG: pirin family protein [Burkholderiaceae bacterium]|nr:pirin family protein [Burkholderiaceae bacterium]
MEVLDPVIDVRPGRLRGTFSNRWLHARFSFSFGSWQQPGRESFGPLRALNEDIVQPGSGFDMHPHRNLDIFMLPLSGEVEHRDSLGHIARVRPGQVQRMFAGDGIRHSQMNASTSELDHHLQIWLRPARDGGRPSVETRGFDLFGQSGRWCSVIAPDGRDGSFVVDQEARMSTTCVRDGKVATWAPREGSMVYLHAIDGTGAAHVNGAEGPFQLAAGDALAIPRTSAQPIRVESDGPAARFLIFEFAGSGLGT